MCGRKPCEREDCSWSETHRAACETQRVMAMHKLDRNAYYKLVAKHRGEKAAQELIRAVNAAWSAR